jgi:polyhydroxybutyrate depolymerase
MEIVTLSFAGRDRRYRWYPPAKSPGPAIVFLHGTGGSADWVESETGLAAAAKPGGFAFAVPDALPTNPDQPPRFVTNPQRWNDGSAWPGDPNYKGENDAGFLAALIRDLPGRGADSNRISVTGFSNGAGMTFRLAAEYPELVAAIAPVAGLSWVDPLPFDRPIPTLFLIGDADPLVPLSGGAVQTPWGPEVIDRPSVNSTLERWAAAVGCASFPHELMDGRGVRFQTYEPRRNGARMNAVIIPDLGHHWPGGAGQFNPRIAGQKGSVIDGNEMILEFFRTYG